MHSTKQNQIAPIAPSDTTDNSAGYDDFMLPDFALLKLDEEWRLIYNWCIKQGVGDVFLLIRSGVLFDSHPVGSLAFVFRFLSRPDLREVLKEWSLQDSTAGDLYRLGQAIQADPGVMDCFSGVAYERDERQFRGKLTVLYLLAMLKSQPKEADEEQQTKLGLLKLWVLILALQETKKGCIQEKRLRSVAGFLRKAGNPNHFSRAAFLDMFPDLLDLDLIGEQIFQKADGRLAKLRNEGVLTESERTLLSDIKKLALGKLDRESYQGEDASPPGYRDLLNLPDEIPSERSAQLNELEDPGLSKEPADIPGIEEDEDCLSVETDPEASYAEQKTAIYEALLLDVGKHQFLPYAWSSLSPQEILALEKWVEATLDSSFSSESFLAAVVWIAIHTGQSLHYAMLTTLSDQPGRNWTLSYQGDRLFRIPPHRHHGWEPKRDSISWVYSVQSRLEITLPEWVGRILAEQLAGKMDSIQLWQLAPEASRRSHDASDRSVQKKVLRKYARLFRKLTASAALQRIQPGMLGAAYPQALFNESEDTAYAHLLASRDNRGMLGNCAYPSWYLPDGRTTVEHLTTDRQATEVIHIGLGSRLDPIEQRLIEVISAAEKKLCEIQKTGDLLSFHNALTTYLSVAVLAATGARPVKDLIESPRQIDFEQGFLYVEDKSTGSSTDGRLVPLPPALCKYLGGAYPDYLTLLAKALSNTNAPNLASEIARLAKRQTSEKMPFLFFLDVKNGALSWQPVSEIALENQALFPWPLPWNLFRHRLAKQLRYRSVHPEIIDGLFGHIEGTTASWGSYSLRTWSQDIAVARPALEAAYDNLPFSFPKLSQLPALAQRWAREHLPGEAFGRNARKAARKRYLEKIRATTGLEIDRYVREAEKNDLTELDEEQIEELSRKMMLVPQGPPRKNGWFRYSILIERLELAWHERGKKVRIRSRYAKPYREKARFSRHAPQAKKALDQLQSFALKPTYIKRLGRKSLYQNVVLAVLRLLAENQIADPSLLKDVLYGRNFRLVYYRGNTYLEYAPFLRKCDPRAAVQRYRVSPDTALVLSRALGTRRHWRKDAPPPAWMAPLLQKWGALTETTMPDTLIEIIDQAALWVQQINAQNLPGVVAAYLNGHIHSISPSWTDWIRMDSGVRVQLGEKIVLPAGEKNQGGQPDKEPAIALEDGDEKDLAFPKTIQPVYSTHAWRKLDSETLLSNARDFREMLHAKLVEEEKHGSCNSSECRDRVARELTRLIQQQAETVSSAILLLGQWVARMLFRQVREKGRWRYIRFSSLRRYLGEFGDPFCQLAYQTDLAVANTDTVTELYQKFVEAKSDEGREYAFNRLMDFHDFVRQEDVVDPEWSELPYLPRRFSVAPGIILKQEYLDTLQLLLKQEGLESRFRYAQAFILLCGYRFGTRASEALGLRRKDWMTVFDPVELLIEPNRARSLKTLASRRRVPLLSDLTPLEEDILSHVLLDDALRYKHQSSPFLFDERVRTQEWRLLGGINQTLKHVTGNQRTVLHHARHTAANRVTIALFQPELPSWWNALRIDDLQRERIRKQLLVTPGITRRTSWAGGFYLGHSSPKTTLNNYIHFVGDWADQLLELPGGLPKAPPDQAFVLDDLPPLAPVDTRLLSNITPPLDPVTPSRVLKLLRHVSLGRDCRFIAASMGIDDALCSDLEKLLANLFKKVRVKEDASEGHEKKQKRSRKKGTVKKRDRKKASVNFLWHISIGGWQRMIALAERAETHQPPPKATLQVRELRKVIGATRQLLLWKKNHLRDFRDFIAYFGLQELPFQLAYSPGISKKRLKQARKYGLEPICARPGKAKQPILLDRIQKGGSEEYQVKKRFAAIMTRNQSGDLHGSYEWITLFMAWVIAARQASMKTDRERTNTTQ